MNDDERLRDLFRHARSKDATRLSNFETVVARRQGPGLPGSSATVILLAMGALVTFSTAVPPQPVVSIAEWRSPTAFLLETADDTLLRDLPDIGLSYREDIP